MTEGHNSKAILRGYVERLQNMTREIKDAKEEHIKPLQDDLKGIYAEAAGNGFDKKALKEAVRRAQLDTELRHTVEIYERSLLEDITA